jgi:DNA-binding transcriptional LysR family regulator
MRAVVYLQVMTKRTSPPISTDQVCAFVELARAGSIRSAAQGLHLSEEGLRSRLLTLEARLGINVYEKRRGRHADVRLTKAGQSFLPKAVQFIEDAQMLTRWFDPAQRQGVVQIVASHYLTYYLLVDMIREFNSQQGNVAVQVITRIEQQIPSTLRDDANVTFGICSPTEYPSDLSYRPWFKIGWYFIAQRGHPLLQRSSVSLAELVEEPLIFFERGSTGRQHVLEGFFKRDLTPVVAVEATSTQVILRMVEAGLGSAIVPLLPSGIVTRGLDVGYVSLGDQIRPIENGVMSRPGELSDVAAQTFLDFVLAFQP